MRSDPWMFSTSQHSSSQGKVLLVNFEANYYTGLFIDLAKHLRDHGYQVDLVICESAFTHCISKRNKPESLEATCHKCQLNQNRLVRALNNPKINVYKADSIYNSIGALQPHISNRIRQLAAFDYLMENRTNLKSLDTLQDASFDKYYEELTQLFLWFSQIKDFKPDDIILYCNGNYSANSVLNFFAKEKGIRAISVEPHPLQSDGYLGYKLLENRFPLDSDFLHPDLEDEIGYASPYFTLLFLFYLWRRVTGASHNSYTRRNGFESNSSKTKIAELQSRYKVTHTIFLSSSDEVVAHQLAHNANNIKMPLDLELQIKIIGLIIEKARDSSEILFIIRAHPRQGISKKSRVASIEWAQILSMFQANSLPSNLVVLSPEDSMSSYELIRMSSCCYTLWSTIGVEALFMGISSIVLQPSVMVWPITKLSEQNVREEELLDLIFQNHNLGKPNDKRLIAWASSTMGSTWHYSSYYFNSNIESISGRIFFVLTKPFFAFARNRSVNRDIFSKRRLEKSVRFKPFSKLNSFVKLQISLFFLRVFRRIT